MKLYQHIMLDEEAQELLNSCLPPQINRITGDLSLSEEQQFSRFSSCEIAFGNIPAGWLEKSSVLKWLQLESVGYEPYLTIIPDFSKRGTITNLHGFFGQPVAETALAGILSLKRGIDTLTSLKDKKEWLGSELRSRLSTLQGATVLIAGGGNIGQSFRKILSGFNCKIIIYDTNLASADITAPEEFDLQLPKADIIFSCLPDTDETKLFFNERRFNSMHPSAIFINVGRGAVVDESVLIRKLKDNKIAGAVLDVTNREPLPIENELWECPGLILTQHTGGGSKSELKGKVSIFLENLDLYLAGKPLNRVISI